MVTSVWGFKIIDDGFINCVIFFGKPRYSLRNAPFIEISRISCALLLLVGEGVVYVCRFLGIYNYVYVCTFILHVYLCVMIRNNDNSKNEENILKHTWWNNHIQKHLK